MKISRVLKAINFEEADKIPRGELLIDQEIIDYLTPERDLTEFARKKLALNRLNMDFIVLEPKIPTPTEKSTGNFIDIWGRKVEKRKEYWITTEPAIKNIAEFEDYNFPTKEEFDFSELNNWVADGEFFVFGLLDGIFQGIASLMDFNDFLLATVKHQQELQAFANRYGDFLYQLAKKALEAGAHGLIIGDDFASSQGPLTSPRTMERVFYPVYHKILKKLSKFNKPIFLHCDGNIEFLLPQLKEMGFAGIHSLEPAAGMDLAKTKKEYGQEICLMGNIDPALLEQNDLNELQKTVEEAIEIAGRGGGFILSTASGSLTKEMRIENILAMYQIQEEKNLLANSRFYVV